MKYYKEITDNYISGIYTGLQGKNEITEYEYNQILDIIKSKPIDPPNLYYRLRTDFSWELCEIPIAPEREAEKEDLYNSLIKLGIEVTS